MLFDCFKNLLRNRTWGGKMLLGIYYNLKSLPVWFFLWIGNPRWPPFQDIILALDYMYMGEIFFSQKLEI